MASTPDITPEYIAAYNGGKLVALASAMIPVLLLFVSLRFYARYLRATPWGLDDYLVLVSLFFQIGLSTFVICFVRYGGVGRHFAAWEAVEPSKIVVYYKFLLFGSTYYFFTVGFPKLSILAFYARMFPVKIYRHIIIATACIVAATGIACPIVALNICRPFRYNWDKTVLGQCLNEQAFYRWGSLPNIVTDVIMLIIPLPVIWRLNTSLSVKTGLTMAFAMGSLGLATSIVRFCFFFEASAIVDGSWGSVDLLIWTVVEPAVYLIASCLVTFRPILSRIRETIRASSKRSNVGHKLQPIGLNADVHEANPKRPPVPIMNTSLLNSTNGSVDLPGSKKHQSIVTVSRSETLSTVDEHDSDRIYVRREYQVETSDA